MQASGSAARSAGLLAAQGMAGLVSLFLLNAVTYLAYVGVLLAVVREAPRL
jgi:hypothetical protein